MANILAVDEGPEKSGYVVFNYTTNVVVECGILENNELVTRMHALAKSGIIIKYFVGEMIETYGAANNTLYRSCVWLGRFEQIALSMGFTVFELLRRHVKMHLAGSIRAKDKDLTAILIERFGDPSKKPQYQQGALKGVKSHAWSALAIAVTLADKLRNGEQVTHVNG